MKTTVTNLNYCPFFCEENIWHLCHNPALLSCDRKVLFIFSQKQCVAMKNQRLGNLVHWDYHVVLLFKDTVWKIADFDSSLSFPCIAEEYFTRSFIVDEAPLFRIVDALHYIKNFASDRRHMKNKNGSYLQPPPPWKKIGVGFNLLEFMDVAENEHGEILNLRDMMKYMM